MVINMNDEQLHTLTDLQAFLTGTVSMDFTVGGTTTDSKGRQRKRYPYKLMMTPYEKLKSLPLAEQYLKPAISFKQLDAQAGQLAIMRLHSVRMTRVPFSSKSFLTYRKRLPEILKTYPFRLKPRSEYTQGTSKNPYCEQPLRGLSAYPFPAP
jgi:hypothetical protein